jgi:hypothetical protein
MLTNDVPRGSCGVQLENLSGREEHTVPESGLGDCAARSCAKASAQKSLSLPCAVGVFRSQAASAYGFWGIIGAPGIFIVGLSCSSPAPESNIFVSLSAC